MVIYNQETPVLLTYDHTGHYIYSKLQLVTWPVCCFIASIQVDHPQETHSQVPGFGKF